MTHKLISTVVENKKFFVYKIQEFSYRQRLFCILDTNKPYELCVKYKELINQKIYINNSLLNKKLNLSPIIGGKGGIIINETIDPYKNYFFRLEKEDYCKVYIEEIEYKQKLVTKILEKELYDYESKQHDYESKIK